MLLSRVHSFQIKGLLTNLSIMLGLFLFALLPTSAATWLEKLIQRSKTQSYPRIDGYDCGKSFFTHQMVGTALEMASSEEWKASVRPFIGPLYDINLGYMTWPIVQDEPLLAVKTVPKSRLWRQAKYQVVFTKESEIVDVIVRVSNYDFAKCLRVFSTQREAQTLEIEKAEGYYCGSRYIPKGHLEKSAGYAKEYLGKDEPYPADYIGHLYDRELGYMIWPVYMGEDLYRVPNRRASPYFIVIDPTGNLKDLLIRTMDFEFVKCIASKEDISINNLNTQSQANEAFLKSGYDCSGIFFDDKDIQLAVNMAYESRTSSRKNVFPVKHIGTPCDSPCFLWPIKPSGNMQRNGKLPPYRLVLTLDFEIMYVVMQNSEKIKKCEKKTILSGVSLQNKNNYKCGRTVFFHEELSSTAEAACKKRKQYKSSYPCKYEDDSFEVPGPYLIYPMIKGKTFTSSPGSNFVVINYECVVAGALTMDKMTGDLGKCMRLGGKYRLQLSEGSSQQIT